MGKVWSSKEVEGLLNQHSVVEDSGHRVEVFHSHLFSCRCNCAAFSKECCMETVSNDGQNQNYGQKRRFT